MPRSPTRRVFRGPWALLLLPPALFGFGLLLVFVAGDRAGAVRLLWVVTAVLTALGVWIARRSWRRIVVDDGGLEDIRAGSRRRFAWDELRRIRDETEGWGRHRVRRFTLMAEGGRTLTFREGSVFDAEGLAAIIEDRIREHRPPIPGARAASASAAADEGVGLGNLDDTAAGRGRRKRYRAASKRERILAIVIGILLVAALLGWQLLRG